MSEEGCKEKKVCIILCYWGIWPAYLPFFLLSASKNNLIDFLIVTDNSLPDHIPVQFRHINMDLQEFQKTASEKLGFEVKINHPYKICDFKPLFGYLFEDQLINYNYWGYCDIDVILGQINPVIQDFFNSSDEVFSGYSNFMAGPFSIFKNNKKINHLFRTCKEIERILADPVHYAFDENIQRSEITGMSLKKILSFCWFVITKIFVKNEHLYSWNEVRYQFQLYYKRKSVKPDNPSDFTEIILAERMKGRLNIRFVPLIQSDISLSRKGYHNWSYCWQRGSLKESSTGKEIQALHFQESKKHPGFSVNTTVSGDTFKITHLGIRNM